MSTMPSRHHFALATALFQRERTGKGQHIDLAMLDAAAWGSRCQWMGRADAVERHVLACADGYVLSEGAAPADLSLKARTRAEACVALTEMGLRATPVLSLSEAIDHPQVKAAGVLTPGRSPNGDEWPLVASPISMSRTAPRVRRAPGVLDGDAADVIKSWDLTWRDESAS